VIVIKITLQTWVPETVPTLSKLHPTDRALDLCPLSGAFTTVHGIVGGIAWTGR